ELTFFLDDRAFESQARVLLPKTANASAGLLAFLLRGQLVIAREGDGLSIRNAGPTLARGTLTVLSEDASGRRHPVAAITQGEFPIATGGEAARVSSIPTGAKRLVAVFRGQDAAGEPLVAIEDVASP